MSVMTENKSFRSNHYRIRNLSLSKSMVRSDIPDHFSLDSPNSSRLFIANAIHQQELYPFNNYLSEGKKLNLVEET